MNPLVHHNNMASPSFLSSESATSHPFLLLNPVFPSPPSNPLLLVSLCFRQNMADSFLDGDVTLDTFIDAYQSNRKLAHLRRVKIEKLQEMVLTGQRRPLAPPAGPALSSGATPLQAEASAGTHSPVAQPRRKPPQPPLQPLPSPGPAPPAAAPPAQPPVFYSASPYPPIPPRSGQQFPNIPAGYPSPYLSQYPGAQYAPALPQRPQGRLAHQPGFIMQ